MKAYTILAVTEVWCLFIDLLWTYWVLLKMCCESLRLKGVVLTGVYKKLFELVMTVFF